ncbi:MAG: hypothetical protein A2511_09245 [Deltaproteobacteria bacterium RIFOXYD12_FULL_50_9]|nr:MAG: hypothetical protein A2511_09245 [Deltaproteobacteria bacterium RIFOXYD12_FULL_50_9]
MKKYIALCLAVLLGCSVAQADEPGATKQSFWNRVRAKIEQIIPKKNVAKETVVGGVRGDKEERVDLYWKGADEKAVSAPAEEIEAFQKALEYADKGEKEAARAAFDKFLTTYPDSSLLPDAQQALQFLAAGE